jgi:hypothetical protein
MHMYSCLCFMSVLECVTKCRDLLSDGFSVLSCDCMARPGQTAMMISEHGDRHFLIIKYSPSLGCYSTLIITFCAQNEDIGVFFASRTHSFQTGCC